MKATAGGHKNALVERGRKELEATGRRAEGSAGVFVPKSYPVGWDGALLTAEEAAAVTWFA